MSIKREYDPEDIMEAKIATYYQMASIKQEKGCHVPSVLKWFQNNPYVDKNQPIMDIGLFNKGQVITMLARDGFKNLTGVDFFDSNVDEVRNALKNYHAELKAFNIVFGDTSEYAGKFRVVHDKFMLDTIDFVNLKDREGIRKLYKARVTELLEDGGLYVVLSSVFTECTLAHMFEDDFVMREIFSNEEATLTDTVQMKFRYVVLQKKKMYNTIPNPTLENCLMTEIEEELGEDFKEEIKEELREELIENIKEEIMEEFIEIKQELKEGLKKEIKRKIKKEMKKKAKKEAKKEAKKQKKTRYMVIIY